MKLIAALKKLWPTLISVGVGALSFLNPSIQAFAASHPNYTTAIVSAWAVFCHWLQSPNASAAPKA